MNGPTQSAKGEHLTPSQRAGELVAMGVMLLCFSFFVYHQTAHTGFFTAKFDTLAMFYFYGPMLLSLLAPLVRAVVGRRNPARLAEAVTNLFQTIAAIWLLAVFPFNFAHLADALPSPIRFLFAWVNNDIGRVVLIIMIVVCPLVALARIWQFVAHLWREAGDRLHAHPAL